MSILVDTSSPLPIYEQICGQVLFAVASGKFSAGERLPSARGLAGELSVNFHTVSKAYAHLAEQGFITMDRQRGAVVSEIPAENKHVTPEMSGKLNLLAAEAVCRGLDYMSFVGHCMQSYRVAKGEQTVQ